MNGASKSSSIRSAFSHCVQQVRNYDYHHYLCLLHLPSSMRKAAFALRSFNIETSRAMDVASDPKIGLMRLLWWQDAIDKIHEKKIIEHPTALALSSVILEKKISKIWLKRSVEARISDANRDPNTIPETIKDLEKYAEDTTSTFLYMTLQAGGIQSAAADHAASHIGKASGLLLLLKSLPYHASRTGKLLYMPADVAANHGLLIKQHGIVDVKMDSGESLSNAVFEIASAARMHLRKAQELAVSVPLESLPVLLPAVPVKVMLDSLEKYQFNVFDSRLSQGILGVSPLWFQLKLNWYAWRGKY
ncbi:Squalene/phytoene synthase [Zostera marina]|uniref:Squalene/phytoene synthase n=1 Tax=Zostera marina TaxID=29655 RepID=A0A0K9PNJ6_ZOSMR|nr:Squalene/phytoene synthase [Zostera marina]